MTSRDFVYWLNGYFEIGRPTSLGVAETDMVRRHLALVFKHEIDPSIDGGDLGLATERKTIHDGTPIPTIAGESPGIGGVRFNWPDTTQRDCLISC